MPVCSGERDPDEHARPPRRRAGYDEEPVQEPQHGRRQHGPDQVEVADGAVRDHERGEAVEQARGGAGPPALDPHPQGQGEREPGHDRSEDHRDVVGRDGPGRERDRGEQGGQHRDGRVPHPVHAERGVQVGGVERVVAVRERPRQPADPPDELVRVAGGPAGGGGGELREQPVVQGEGAGQVRRHGERELPAPQHAAGRRLPATRRPARRAHPRRAHRCRHAVPPSPHPVP